MPTGSSGNGGSPSAPGEEVGTEKGPTSPAASGLSPTVSRPLSSEQDSQPLEHLSVLNHSSASPSNVGESFELAPEDRDPRFTMGQPHGPSFASDPESVRDAGDDAAAGRRPPRASRDPVRRDVAASKPMRRQRPVLFTTRISSAAVDSPQQAEPTPVPTPATGARAILPELATGAIDVTLDATSSRHVGPSTVLGQTAVTPEPMIVRIVDRKRSQRRGEPAAMRRELAIPGEHTVVAPAALRTTDELRARAVEQLRPIPTSYLTPEPMRRWEPVGLPPIKERKSRALEPMAIRTAHRQDDSDASIRQHYQKRAEEFGKEYASPKATAAALLRLQATQAVQPSGARSRSCEAIDPAGDLSRHHTDPQAVPSVARRKPAASPDPRRDKESTRPEPAYVPPHRRKLAPIKSMPKRVDGSPVFDSRAVRAAQRTNALLLADALAGQLETSTAGSPESGGDKGRDPIAEVVASIPLALRRHMVLPKSEAAERRTAAVRRKMRHFQRETKARLQRHDAEVDALIAEAAQRHVYEMQRDFAKQEALEAARTRENAGL